MNTLPTRKLGTNGPTVSAIGFGAMSMGAAYGKVDEEEAFITLTHAADRGMTFWDTADIYGDSEKLLGRWFSQTGRRSDIFLATKFGAYDLDVCDFNKPNSKPAYIRRRLENSLADLQTDYIDLYYQHRVDPEVPIEVVLETLRPFLEIGTIKWIALSEVSAATVRRAKAVKGVGEKVIAAQMEFSPFELSIEKNGFVDAIKEAGMAVVAYSPLARGLVTGKFRSRKDFEEGDMRLTRPKFSEENFPKNLKVVDALHKIGEKHGATGSQVTLAWILAEHPNFVPIPGSRNAQRLEENARGAEITLSKEDLEEIRSLVESAEVAGGRYPSSIIESTGDCIPLSAWTG
ncbi:hypothetical protein DXG01_004484 [Tephrocybe rancida]|nr:hypothetical protein DXG01_004484 [Tephrocybe rancida]